IVALDTGRIRSFEALLRWSHPQLGLIPPAEFVPVAEEIGLIARLGGWTLAEACRQLSRWQRQSSAAATLAINVNVSNRQLMEPDFCAQLEQVLLETGIGGRSLNLEITESTLVTASAALARRLNELKQLGVQLHMDDFGTGYSSLGYLHSSPFDVVKIDRAFVSNLSASREYTAVVHAIITLARNLNIKVTAEGLETEEQLAQILTLDCDYAQGYYFSEPLEAEAAAALLAADGPWLTPRRARPEPLWFRSTPSRIAEAASLVHG
ncbi:MAG TPA: EAL domain-containing protein, partial [Phycisphaerae bacterium]